MIIEGPVFCLEEFRLLDDVHLAMQKIAAKLKAEIKAKCPELSIKSVRLREKANTWTTRPDLMQFCVECDNPKSDEIQIEPSEYINKGSSVSAIIERETPFLIKLLHEA